MKVLQLAKYHPSFFYGGIETVVKSFNKAHKENQDSIHTVVKRGTSSNDFTVISDKLFYLKRIWWIYKNINSYDLVYIHLPNILVLLPALLFCRNKKKLVCVYHSDVLKFSILGKLYQFITHTLLEFVETIICSSDEFIQSSHTLKFYQHKCHVIHFAIPHEEIAKSNNTLEDKYILMIAREGHYKGLEFALSSLNELSYKIKIVGPKKENYQNFEFYNNVDEVEKMRLIDGCEFLLMSSTSSAESYGMVIVEAFARSKAVVAPDLGTGVNFLIGIQKRGFLYSPSNKKSLLESVTKLKGNDKVREKFEANIVDFYNGSLSFKIFKKRLSDLVRKKVST